jgi:hypothetical protein
VALIPRATFAPTYCRRNPRMSRQRPSRRFEEMVDLISSSSDLLMDCCKADTMTPFENSETLYSKACRCNRQTTELPPPNGRRHLGDEGGGTNGCNQRMESTEWINPTDSAEVLIPSRILSVLAEYKVSFDLRPTVNSCAWSGHRRCILGYYAYIGAN